MKIIWEKVPCVIIGLCVGVILLIACITRERGATVTHPMIEAGAFGLIGFIICMLYAIEEKYSVIKTLVHSAQAGVGVALPFLIKAVIAVMH